jgi:superoxide dismutase, Fe-Mn family
MQLPGCRKPNHAELPSAESVAAMQKAVTLCGAHGGATLKTSNKEPQMPFSLPELPYPYEALQPYLSKETLEFHHDKHHAAYVTTANNLLKDSGLEGKSLEDVVKESYGKNVPLFNNAAQHYNHSEYWKSIKPGGASKVPGELEKALIESFGSIEKVKQDLVQAGTTQFGSGWAWLVVKDGKIAVAKTGNAENPLISGGVPILTVDVWEHTYYIDYRNRRPDYLKAFVDNLVNWEYVAERYAAALS